MAIDYCLAFDCDAKRHFGRGDCMEGADAILRRLGAKSRADLIRQMAAAQGEDPYKMEMSFVVSDANGMSTPQKLKLAELEARVQALDAQSKGCRRCSANLLGEDYGCFGCINYPVPRAAEEWLLGRLQPPGTFGAAMCLDFMADFEVTGQAVARMRKQGFFESTKARRVVLHKRFLRNRHVTADQVLAAFFDVGNPMEAGHCLTVLLWFGAIAANGVVPADPSTAHTLQTILDLDTPRARRDYTQLQLGSYPANEAASPFAHLLRTMYQAWVLDIPVLIST